MLRRIQILFGKQAPLRRPEKVYHFSKRKGRK